MLISPDVLNSAFWNKNTHVPRMSQHKYQQSCAPSESATFRARSVFRDHPIQPHLVYKWEKWNQTSVLPKITTETIREKIRLQLPWVPVQCSFHSTSYKIPSSQLWNLQKKKSFKKFIKPPIIKNKMYHFTSQTDHKT